MSQSIVIQLAASAAALSALLGAAFYVLLGDWLSTLWPRWLLILGVVLMVVSLGMQGGLWGLCQKLWQLARGGKADGKALAPAKEGHA